MNSQNLSNVIRELLEDKQQQRLLAENEAAKYLGINPGTLSVWRSSGRYHIPYIKVGGRVRYRLSDLEEWLESRTTDKAGVQK